MTRYARRKHISKRAKAGPWIWILAPSSIPQLNAPFNNPQTSSVTAIEVTDSRHPLFGRRFEIVSPVAPSRHASYVMVLYRDPIRLRIPVSATDLAPPRHGPVSKLTLAAVTELVTLLEHAEGLCPSPPTPSGTGCHRRSKRPSLTISSLSCTR